MTLMDHALQPLVSTLNQLLALDPASAERLAKLEGRSIAIRLTAPALTIQVLFNNGMLNLSLPPPTDDLVADASVSGTPVALLALARDPEQGGDAVEFSGDLGLVRELRTLLAQTDIDWEEQVARILGDIPAHQLGRAARGFLSWLQSSRTSVETGLADYLTEESRELPTSVEAELFFSEVDRLRQDADRLTARLQILEKRRQSERGEP